MFVLSASAAGAATGALFGMVGRAAHSILPPTVAGVAVVLAVILAVDALGAGLRVPQRDIETSRRWLDDGPTRWSAKTGLALGVGAGTRLGFIGWYVIPLTTIALASVDEGAVVWGTYAMLRTLASVALGWPRFGSARRFRPAIAPMLLDRRAALRRLSSASGCVVALVLAIDALGSA